MDNQHLNTENGTEIAISMLKRYFDKRNALGQSAVSVSAHQYQYFGYDFEIKNNHNHLFLAIKKAGDKTAQVYYPILNCYNDFKFLLDIFIRWKLHDQNLRYFWFSYQWSAFEDEPQKAGTIAIVFKGFPSNKQVKQAAGALNVEHFIITNWREFQSESDYRSFVNYHGDFHNPEKSN